MVSTGFLPACAVRRAIRAAMRLGLLLLLAGWAGASPAQTAARELLSNRSFETPVTVGEGNHFYATIPDWTVVELGRVEPTPFNIVRATTGLCCDGAGGSQYLDITTTSARIRQSFTLAEAGSVRFSGWFSTRAGVTTLSGSQLALRNSAETLLASVAVNFTSSDPYGTWKQGVSQVIWLPAGTYHFDVSIPDHANFDLASVELQPAYALNPAAAMAQCPVAPALVTAPLSSWTMQSADPAAPNSRDTARIAAAGAMSFGPGLQVSYIPAPAFKPKSGSWQASVPDLAAAISTGSYAQVSFTTAENYEASRMVFKSYRNFVGSGYGTFQMAMFLSTSPTFETATELSRDLWVSATIQDLTLRPLLQQNTTYYLRSYFYNATTPRSDGTVVWDDLYLRSGTCSSLNPAADSARATPGTAQPLIANIAANDQVNGWSATLGTSGNATLAQRGGWPAGVTLDPLTGALTLEASAGPGSYALGYRLCDRGPTPVCADSTIALTLALPLSVTRTVTVLSDPINAASLPRAIPGATLRHCMVVHNPAGNPTATQITLRDSLPPGVQSASLRIVPNLSGSSCDPATAIPGGTVSAATVEATLPDLPGGTSAGFSYETVVP